MMTWQPLSTVAVETGVSGIIATNTTIGRPIGLSGVHAGEQVGCLVGHLLRQPAS